MMYQAAVESVWREEELPPFDELMITWNAARPVEGKYLFSVRVKTDKWTPWLLYASWGSENQASCHSATSEAPVRVYQDVLEVKEGSKATAFQIQIVPEGQATLDQIRGLYVYTNSDKAEDPQQTLPYSSPVHLPLKGLSQMTLNHIRHRDLCSPTSTTAVVRYLSNKTEIDPIHFAEKAWDGGFNIFGNWVFNVSQAAAELGPSWDCWVERLSGFDAIYRRLHLGIPVIISVRGPLPGSAEPYAKGHLMVVIGYEPQEQKVICMDPAFPSDEQTVVRYALSDLLQAWNRRGRVAYIFSNRATVST